MDDERVAALIAVEVVDSVIFGDYQDGSVFVVY